MTVTAQAAVALMRIQSMRPQFRYSFRLVEDKPLVPASMALGYIQARVEHDKPTTPWLIFAEAVMTETIHGA